MGRIAISIPPQLLFLLATGTTLNLLGQVISDKDFLDPGSHVLPYIKFAASFAFAGASRLRRGGGPAAPPTAQQRRLMAAIGLLDAAAYTAFCVGFVRCGAALSTLLLASAGQVLTALATRYVLGRRLSRGQLAGIACVCAGLALRALPAELFGGSGSARQPAARGSEVAGAAAILLSALLYSGVGVAYDRLVKGVKDPPQHADITWYTSLLGFGASSLYQALYTLPRWDTLVAARMAARGLAAADVLPLLAAFAAAFNLHTYAQGLVFKSDGAVGVGLVNAVRGAVITALAARLFCAPARPWQCLSVQSGLAAAVTTLGGVVWVVAGSREQRQKQPVAARTRAKSKLQ